MDVPLILVSLRPSVRTAILPPSRVAVAGHGLRGIVVEVGTVVIRARIRELMLPRLLGIPDPEPALVVYVYAVDSIGALTARLDAPAALASE